MNYWRRKSYDVFRLWHTNCRHPSCYKTRQYPKECLVGQGVLKWSLKNTGIEYIHQMLSRAVKPETLNIREVSWSFSFRNSTWSCGAASINNSSERWKEVKSYCGPVSGCIRYFSGCLTIGGVVFHNASNENYIKVNNDVVKPLETMLPRQYSVNCTVLMP